VADPAFTQRLVGQPADALVPQFIVGYLPARLLGLAVAGILAAALSSIDSALNSLSAVTLAEFLPVEGQGESRNHLLWARLATLAWGLLALGFAWWFSRGEETVIEMVNRVGSLVYGPILGVFVLAWGSQRATGHSAVLGGVLGVGTTLLISVLAPDVSWLWWNPLGCLVTLVVGHLFTFGKAVPLIPKGPADPRARDLARLLIAAFVAILVILSLAPRLG